LLLRCALVALEPEFQLRVQLPLLNYSAPFTGYTADAADRAVHAATRDRYWLAFAYCSHSPMRNDAVFYAELRHARDCGYELASAWCKNRLPRLWFDQPAVRATLVADDARVPLHVLLHRARSTGSHYDAIVYCNACTRRRAEDCVEDQFRMRSGTYRADVILHALVFELRNVLVRSDVLYAVLWRSPLRALPHDVLQRLVADAMPYALYSEIALGCARARRRLGLAVTSHTYDALAQVQTCPIGYRLLPP